MKEIAGLAAAGDGHSLDTFAITAAYLGDAMKDLVNGLGIERLVFGGRISRAFPFMETELRSRFGSGVALSRSRMVSIRLSPLRFPAR